MSRISKQLIALPLLITSSLTLSGERGIHQDIVVQRITAISNPMRAAFLSKKNNLVIGGKNGISEVNWKQDKKIADIIPSGHARSFIINQQRNAVAGLDIFNNERNDHVSGKVVLYDIEKQKVTWESLFKEEDPSFIFTHSNTLYVFQKDGNVRCSNGKSYHILEARKIHKDAIAADSKEEEIIFSNEYRMNSSCSELHGLRFDQKSFSISLYTTLNNEVDTAKVYAYSPFNKILALRYYRKNEWMLYDRENKQRISTNTHLKNCYSFAFHPKNVSVLAIITQDGFVEIYDFYKNKTLAKTYNSLWSSTPHSSLIQTSIDFSEDGENLVVTIGAGDNNRCLVLSNLYPKNNE